MQLKAKRSEQQGMSRRQFLQVAIATGAIASSAGIFALWGNTPEAVHYSYSWVRPDVLRLNQNSSNLLREALFADGFAPAQVKVYDRAMEYKTAFSSDGQVVSRELLFRDNETAEINFTVDGNLMSDDAQASIIESVSDLLAQSDNFRVQKIDISFLSQ